MPSPNYIESPNATIRQSCIFTFQIEKAFSVGHSTHYKRGIVDLTHIWLPWFHSKYVKGIS